MRAFHYITPFGVLQVETWTDVRSAVCRIIPAAIWRAGEYVPPGRRVPEWERGDYVPFVVDRDSIPKDWPVQEVEV